MTDIYTISGYVCNARSLLDITAEYSLAGQDNTETKLENIIFAIETARDAIRRAEEALCDYRPPKGAREAALELENAGLKEYIIQTCGMEVKTPQEQANSN